MQSSNWRGKDLDFVVHLREYDGNPEMVRYVVFPKLNQFLLDLKAERYGYIIHDRDIEKDERELEKRRAVGDNGTMEIIHIHCCVEFPQSERSRYKSTWINKIADYLGVDVRAVTLDKLSSFEGAFQYLVHKNEDKFKYPCSDIVTSLSTREVDTIMSMELQCFTLDKLCDCLDECGTLRELIYMIGFKKYVAYRPVIMDLWKEKAYQRSLDTKLVRLEEELRRIYDGCMSLTAEPKYIHTGVIPLKDYEDLLIACSKQLEDYISFKRKTAKAKASQ